MTIHLKECHKRIRQPSIQSFDYLWVHLEEFGVYFGVFCQFFFVYIGIPLPPPPPGRPCKLLDIFVYGDLCPKLWTSLPNRLSIFVYGDSHSLWTPLLDWRDVFVHDDFRLKERIP